MYKILGFRKFRAGKNAWQLRGNCQAPYPQDVKRYLEMPYTMFLQ